MSGCPYILKLIIIIVFCCSVLPPVLMFLCGRAQAIAIGQALVDGRWLDCVTHHDQLFRDEYALYRPLQVTTLY